MDHAGEDLQGLATVECGNGCGPGLLCATAGLRLLEHLGRKRDDHLIQPAAVLPPHQEIDGIPDFDRVASSIGERLVHVGQKRARTGPGSVGDIDKGAGEPGGILWGFHEGAIANLHVQYECLEPGSELLRKDGGSDERHGLHRRGHVADGVKAPIRRREIPRLANDGTAHIGNDPAEQHGIRHDIVARDRLELVQRPASMAEPPAGDHRHCEPAGRDDGGKHQGDVVSDTTGRMLVGYGPAHTRPIHDLAGIAHGKSERDRFVAGHAPKEDSHGEGSSLPFADIVAGQPFDEGRDLLSRKFLPVALPADDLLGNHAVSSPWLRAARRRHSAPPECRREDRTHQTGTSTA